jgi:hypothetical protein
MQTSRPIAAMTWTIVFSAVAAAAAAQPGAGPQISQRAGYFTFGGTIGGGLAETPDGIPDLAAHVEVPLTTMWSVRGQIGRQRELVHSRATTDAVKLRRFTTSLMMFNPRRDGGHNYVFVGIGAYQYRYARNEADDETRMAGHAGIGAESPAIGPVVLNIELTFRRDFRPQNVSPLTLACGFKVRY